MRRLAALAAATLIGFWQYPAQAISPSEPPRSPSEPFKPQSTAEVPPPNMEALYGIILWSEFRGKQTPSDAYLARQRQCETGDNPRNGGQYAGAYGMFVGTWRTWGGGWFAPTPDQATPLEQTIVWIRVAVTGFANIPKAGWLLNSCWKESLPLEWVTR